MRYLIIVMILLSLTLFSCDRFEHKFTATATDDLNALFFSPLQDGFDGITASDLSALSGFYKEDYIHNGISKSERLAWIQGFLNDSRPIVYQLSEVSYSLVDEHNANANWRLTILTPDTREILADSLFQGEKLVKVDAQWLLYGNQVCIAGNVRQLVIAEYFTFRTCPNCPPAEVKLQDLQNQYPENFIYLEHHITMELAVPGDQTFNYYSAYAPPVTVFQGMEKVTQSNPASLSQYQAIVDNLAQVELPVYYTINDLEINGNGLTAQIFLDPQIDLQQEDMVLNAVIITDEVEYQNYDQQPLHNVVRGKSSISLATADLTQAIPIAVSTTDSLPQSFKLVVFAQRKPNSFSNNSTIYGGIVHPVSLAK